MEPTEKPFLVPVCASGVPHFVSHAAGSFCSLSGLLPQIVADFYWRLRSLSVLYSYRIEDRIFSGDLVLNSDCEPVERIGTAVIFEEFRSFNLERNRQFRLDLGNIGNCGDGTYGFDFFFEEVLGFESDFLLTTRTKPGLTELGALTSSVNGQPLKVFLYSRYGSTPAGGIDRFEITCEFF